MFVVQFSFQTSFFRCHWSWLATNVELFEKKKLFVVLRIQFFLMFCVTIAIYDWFAWEARLFYNYSPVRYGKSWRGSRRWTVNSYCAKPRSRQIRKLSLYLFGLVSVDRTKNAWMCCMLQSKEKKNVVSFPVLLLVFLFAIFICGNGKRVPMKVTSQNGLR